MDLSGIQAPRMDWNSSNLPEAFDKFERHVKLMFSGPLKNKSEEEHVSYFLLWIGDRGRDIHSTWKDISPENAKKIKTYYERFRNYVQPKLNPIFARYKFYKQMQDNDSIDAYITRLQLIAQDCNFAEKTDEMIRDRIVFGTNSPKLREKLINIGAGLTLDVAVQTAQSLEYSREQLRSMNNEVDACRSRPVHPRPMQPHRQRQQRRTTATDAGPSLPTKHKPCFNCDTFHNFGQCPAKGKQCRKCNKLNHFAKCCRSKNNNIHTVDNDTTSHDVTSDVDGFNIDTVSTFCSTDRAMIRLPIGPNKCPISFKIDTGSSVNILPKKEFNGLNIHSPLEPPTDILTAYTGNRLPVVGKIKLRCSHKDKTVSTWFHVVDSPSVPLLSLSTSTDLGLIQLTCTVDCPSQELNKESVLSDYKDLFEGIGVIPGTCKLHLKPDAIPVVNPPRRVPEALRNRLHEELDRMENNDIIAKVNTPTDWVNSLVVVEKPNTGQLRICLDPKALNDAIRRPHYPMPTLDDVTSQLAECKYFSLLDITHAYWSVRLDEESSYLTTFSTPFGRYRYLRLPFGIKSSQDIFVQKIDEIFGDLTGVRTIVDDILISGRTRIEHDRNLTATLQRARENGIKFNPDKCRIGLSEVPFFGHVITSSGLKPDSTKIEACVNVEAPKTRGELETFLGMVTYLQKFAPNLAEITSPLRMLLKKDVEFVWDQPQSDAFSKVKQVITQSPVLAYFDPKKPVYIECDASMNGVGAAIMQDGQPVAYASKTLTQTERNYANIEREMLAIVFACQRFHQYIYGRHVIVHSDHKPLSAIMKKPLHAAPPRLQRMMLSLQKYDLDVRHVSGKEVPIGDFLSRQPMSDCSEIEGLDLHVHTVLSSMTYTDRSLENVRNETRTDLQMIALKQTIVRGWPSSRSDCPDMIREYFNHRDELSTADDLIFRGQTLVIPKRLRPHMLEQVHLGHMGIEKSTQRAKDVMFWPGMCKQITEYIMSCTICLSHRNSNQKEPLTPHEIPQGPWQEVATDIFHFDGNDYLLVVDYYSRYFEIDKLPDMLSTTVVRKLKSRFSTHGIPMRIFSDNGPQYTSDVFRNFVKSWHIEHVTSSPHYPKSNGLAERTVQTVKRLLQKAKDSGHEPYLALLEYKNTPLSDCNRSPVQLLMSKRTRSIMPTTVTQLLPKVVNPDFVRSSIQTSKNKQKNNYDKTAKPLPRLHLNETVRFQIGKLWKPAKVIEIHNANSYIIQTPSGQVYRRNRRYLIRTNEDFPEISDFTPDVLARNHSSTDKQVKQPTNNSALNIQHPSVPVDKPISPYQTRSGRIVQPSQRYAENEWTK